MNTSRVVLKHPFRDIRSERNGAIGHVGFQRTALYCFVEGVLVAESQFSLFCSRGIMGRIGLLAGCRRARMGRGKEMRRI